MLKRSFVACHLSIVIIACGHAFSKALIEPLAFEASSTFWPPVAERQAKFEALALPAHRRGLTGTDYPTADGTAIRDYVHVCDLARAHVLALQHLLSHGDTIAINLGNGHGASVRQVIDMVRSVTGREVSARDAPRRAGDPSILVADANKAGRLSGPISRRSSPMPGAGTANGSHEHPGPQRDREQPEGSLSGSSRNSRILPALGWLRFVKLKVKERKRVRRHCSVTVGV
jgi:hypothetical protein